MNTRQYQQAASGFYLARFTTDITNSTRQAIGNVSGRCCRVYMPFDKKCGHLYQCEEGRGVVRTLEPEEVTLLRRLITNG